MYDQADLIGAVRLPSGAHRRTAGTEALTDILILRRREPGQEPGDDGWLLTTPLRVEGELLDKRVNRYTSPITPSGSWATGRSGTACTAPTLSASAPTICRPPPTGSVGSVVVVVIQPCLHCLSALEF